jgi:uncharacterized membrane protein (TIGR02234 family)
VSGQGREHRSEERARSGGPRGSERGTWRERRELTTAVLGSAAAGGLALFAVGQTWATLSTVRPAPLPPVTGVLTGSTHAPLAAAGGLVLLAAAVAVLAVRGTGRSGVGVLMIVSGLAVVWTAGRALAGGLAEAAAEVPVVVGTPVVDVSAVWPAVTVVAGVLGALAGLLVVLRGRRWPGMGSRYERGSQPGAGAPAGEWTYTDEERASLAWKALDRGEDPTDPVGPGPGARPV